MTRPAPLGKGWRRLAAAFAVAIVALGVAVIWTQFSGPDDGAPGRPGPPGAVITVSPVPTFTPAPTDGPTSVVVVPQPEKTVIKKPGGTRTVTASPRALKTARPSKSPTNKPTHTTSPSPTPLLCQLPVVCRI